MASRLDYKTPSVGIEKKNNIVICFIKRECEKACCCLAQDMLTWQLASISCLWSSSSGISALKNSWPTESGQWQNATTSSAAPVLHPIHFVEHASTHKEGDGYITFNRPLAVHKQICVNEASIFTFCFVIEMEIWHFLIFSFASEGMS